MVKQFIAVAVELLWKSRELIESQKNKWRMYYVFLFLSIQVPYVQNREARKIVRREEIVQMKSGLTSRYPNILLRFHGRLYQIMKL